MGLILVKRLFEVHLLHDYYLTGVDGESFFELPADQKAPFLKERLYYDQYRLLKEVTVSPTARCQELLRANKLFFANTRLGFIVGVEVKSGNRRERRRRTHVKCTGPKLRYPRGSKS